MPKDKRRDHVRSVRRVRDSFLTLTDYALGLPEKAKKILKLLDSGTMARDVAFVVPCSKSTVYYWKNKFLNIGALRLVKTDVFKEYALTSYGSTILTPSESGVGPGTGTRLKCNVIRTYYPFWCKSKFTHKPTLIFC